MTDTVLTYKGRPITDLSKNELVAAITWALQEIEYQRERADRFLNAAALAKPEPERLTVQEISDLPRHGENYIGEYRDGEIQLDGYFSRADLQQLADSIPNTHD